MFLLSNKFTNAESIEDILKDLLGYDDNTEAAENGISADYFDQSDNVRYLKKGIEEAIEKVNIGVPYRQHLMQLLRETENVPFQQAAEFWEMIVVLLKYIDNINSFRK